jgi:nitrogen fixation/metabolism regulation signal transduction histidine kinase
MIFKKFRINIILRVVFLLLSSYLFFYVLLETDFWTSAFIIAFLIILQTISLIRYAEQTNKYLVRFLEAIKYSDFSHSFSISGLGPSFDELKNSFTEVIKAFQKSRVEKEEHYRYLQNVIQHIGIGLIAFQKSGDVKLLNSAAKKLFGINQLKNIQSLNEVSEELIQKLKSIKAGERELVKIVGNNEMFQLIIYATEFKLQSELIKLVSIQNIQGELEEKEMEAWQKLIRVLTHEIMNSITPISSLSDTANKMLKEIEVPTNQSIQDIQKAINTIHRRSEGLLHFVQAYRSLTRLPTPSFKIIKISDLFERICQLVALDVKERNINFEYDINPSSLELTCDQELIEQVLLNILQNAFQALKSISNPIVEMKAHIGNRGQILFEITDNGEGIPIEVQEKIFIPFFTTKESGSGIGLSLSQQIMRQHKGIISVNSASNQKTCFTLRF